MILFPPTEQLSNREIAKNPLFALQMARGGILFREQSNGATPLLLCSFPPRNFIEQRSLFDLRLPAKTNRATHAKARISVRGRMGGSDRAPFYVLSDSSWSFSSELLPKMPGRCDIDRHNARPARRCSSVGSSELCWETKSWLANRTEQQGKSLLLCCSVRFGWNKITA